MVSLRFSALALLFSLSPIAAATNPAGKTMIAKGDVKAYEEESSSRKLRRRAPIFDVDTVETATKSKAQFRMNDGTLLALKENSKLLIAEYNYNEEEGGGSAVLELVEGGLRSVTGAIKSNNGTYELKTPVGSIGIRGTHYEVEIVSGEMFIAVWDGAIDLTVETDTGTDQVVSFGEGEDFSYGIVTEEGEVTQLLEPPANFSEGHSDDQDDESDDGSGSDDDDDSSSSDSDDDDSGSSSSDDDDSSSSSSDDDDSSSSSSDDDDSSSSNSDDDDSSSSNSDDDDSSSSSSDDDDSSSSSSDDDDSSSSSSNDDDSSSSSSDGDDSSSNNSDGDDSSSSSSDGDDSSSNSSGSDGSSSSSDNDSNSTSGSDPNSGTSSDSASSTDSDSTSNTDSTTSSTEDSSSTTGTSGTATTDTSSTGAESTTGDTSGTSPDNTGTTPDNTGTSPDNSGTSPDTSGTTPDTSGDTSPDTTPDTSPTTTPDPGSTTPDTGSTSPDTGTNTDTGGTGTSDTGTVSTPDAGIGGALDSVSTTPTGGNVNTPDTGASTTENNTQTNTEEDTSAQEELIDQAVEESTPTTGFELAQRTGVFTYDNVISSTIEQADNGPVSDLSVSMEVNFDQGVVDQGQFSLTDSGGEWFAAFQGRINFQAATLDLNVNFASHGNNPASGTLGGLFTDDGDRINGNFDLTDDVTNAKVIGGFVVEQ